MTRPGAAPKNKITPKGLFAWRDMSDYGLVGATGFEPVTNRL